MKKALLYIYKTFFFEPLTGGNGKIQTSEYVQWILVIMIIRASIREGQSIEQVYPDIFWIGIFTVVASIAGFKHVFPKADPPTQPPVI